MGVCLFIDAKEVYNELVIKDEELKPRGSETFSELNTPQDLKKFAHERYEARRKGSIFGNR